MDTVQCPRCGDTLTSGRQFCARCGLAHDPHAAMLPTLDALEAGKRNAAWLEAHPEDGPAEPDLSAFRDPEWPGRWAEIGLALVALASLFRIAFDAWHLSVLGRDLSVPANAQASRRAPARWPRQA